MSGFDWLLSIMVFSWLAFEAMDWMLDSVEDYPYDDEM